MTLKLVRRLLEHRLACVIVLYVIGVAIYSNTFQAPFVYDDHPNIRDNPSVQLRAITLDGLYGAAFESVSKRRPVAFLSFALNYRLGGYDVRGYHLVNLFVHIANAVLVYLLLLELLPRWLSTRRPSHWHVRLAALLGAMVFLTHPIQTQSVTYVVQRMTSLCALFYLFSLLCYVLARKRRRRRLSLVACGVSGLLALGTKEIAATLPLVMLLVEWTAFQQCRWGWWRRAWPWSAAALGAFVLIGFAYLGFEPLASLAERYQSREFTMTERVLTQLRVLWFYLGLVLYPAPERLSLLHHFTLSTGWLEPPSTLLAGAALALVLGAALAVANRSPIFAFVIFWCFLCLGIESSVVGLELVYEHRMYLPLVGVCAGLAAVLVRLGERSALTWLAAVALVLYLSPATYLRNAVWADPVTLWVDVVSRNPGSARAHNNLGRALLQRGEVDEALAQLNAALFLDPTYADAHNNLGVLYASERQLALAMHHLVEARRLDPSSAQAHLNLALVLFEQGRTADAMQLLRRAIEIQPSYAKAHISLATLLARTGRPEAACEHLEAARKFVWTEKLDEALAHCR